MNDASAVTSTRAAAPSGSLFEPGRNCLAASRAQRAALLIDSDEYYRAFAAAAERARRSIIILGWDFDSRTRLRWREGRSRVPVQLGDFLNYIVRRRTGLNVYILDWDYPMLFGTERESHPLYGTAWKPRRRVHLRYDNTHPVGGSHHQKIVVIDDELAFAGGIDLASRRWDTCEHAAEDDRRKFNGLTYPPIHDVMTVVDGDAARVLAQIARERWQQATKHAIPSYRGRRRHDPWPRKIEPDLTDVGVAISRTMPTGSSTGEVREVEALYLDMIAAAKRHVYIENQYFTSQAIGDALAARLAGPDPPEIVLVTRLLSHGWLEEQTMHLLRVRLISQLRQADARRRFDVYYPHIEGLSDGTCLDVHSKLMVIDDEWLRVGSANLSNRSMGLDSECDVTFEASGRADVARRIRDLRCRLLAEHLARPLDEVRTAVDRTDSVHDVIRELQGGPRSLRALDTLPEPSAVMLNLAAAADPERPVSMDRLIETFGTDTRMPGRGPAWIKLALLVLVLAALALAWRYTPLAEFVTADYILQMADDVRGNAWAPLVVIAAYSVAAFVLFPRPLITLLAIMTFGSVLGFVYALAGIAGAALTTYYTGRALPRDTVRHLAGERLNNMSELLRKRGLLAVFAVRIAPVAPFAIIGLVAGAIHVKLWHYMAGTLLGMTPGTLATSVFGDQLTVALRDPSRINYWVIAAVVTCLAIMVVLVRRWFARLQ